VNSKEFWELIEKTHSASEGDPDRQAELLFSELIRLPEAEIIDYQEILDGLQAEAYIAELWEMAYILDMGCSDDGFMDFRAWLIGQGKDVFEKALVDPNSLVDVVEVGQMTKSMSLLYVAQRAYEQKIGSDDVRMPSRIIPSPQLKGNPSDNEAAILERFPRATEKFWNWWLNNMDKWFQA
jgi:hypothetical protein